MQYDDPFELVVDSVEPLRYRASNRLLLGVSLDELEGPTCKQRLQSGFDDFTAAAVHHDYDSLGSNCIGQSHRVCYQRQTCTFMQDFRELGLHAASRIQGEDDGIDYL